MMQEMINKNQRADAAIDRIVVLLRQEDTTYRCTDYMAHERSPQRLETLHEDDSSAVTKEVASENDFHASSPTSGNSTMNNNMNKVNSELSINDVKDMNLETSTHTQRDQSFTFWRQQMFDWACMVVDSFGADREAVAMSFNLLDRYMAKELMRSSAPSITRDDYQLFCMACLYIAVKVLEPYPRKLSVQTLVDMSKNYYTDEVIEQTELDILAALDWHIHAPTALSYTRLFAELFPLPLSMHMTATMATITEIAVSDSFFVACKPSTIGLAAILHAARLNGVHEVQIQLFQRRVQGLPVLTEEFRSVYQQLEKLYCD